LEEPVSKLIFSVQPSTKTQANEEKETIITK